MASNSRLGRTSRRVIAALAWTLAVSLLVACGSSSSSSGGVASVGGGGVSTSPAAATSASSGANREAALLKAAQCMRANGVTTFPDPTVDSSGNVQFTGFRGLNRNDPVVARALTACRTLFRAARPTFTPAQQQKLQDALLAFAKCVRAHGYNMPDPTFGTAPGQGGPFGSVNRNDPTFQKARQACQPILSAARPAGGGGGFFGGGAGG